MDNQALSPLSDIRWDRVSVVGGLFVAILLALFLLLQTQFIIPKVNHNGWADQSYSILTEDNACSGDLPHVNKLIFVGNNVAEPDVVEILYNCNNGYQRAYFWSPDQPDMQSINTDDNKTH